MTCRNGKSLFIFLAVVTVIPQKSVQWDPDAGIVTSWTKYPRVTVNVSSSSGTSDPRSVVDDNDNTMWVSGSCLPSGFVGDPELNLFQVFVTITIYASCQIVPIFTKRLMATHLTL